MVAHRYHIVVTFYPKVAKGSLFYLRSNMSNLTEMHKCSLRKII